MKKTHASTLIALCLLVMAAALTGCGTKENRPTQPTPSTEPSHAASAPSAPAATSAEPSAPVKSVTPVPTESKPVPTETLPAPTEAAVEPVSFDDTLFIGDSRTVGMMDFGKMKGDFFCNVGMSVYNINTKIASVPSVGKVTLKELLANKTYGKVYIMLGINEIGYNLDKTAKKYQELVNQVRESEPNATIFIIANLHVSQKKSDEHEYLKNDSLNRLNKMIAQIAAGDNDNIYFIDPNPAYDDANGALDAKYTPDGIHFHTEYYAQFGKWLASETARVLMKG